MTFPDTALILTLLFTGIVAWCAGILLGLWLLARGVMWAVCRAYPASGRRRAPLPGTAAEDAAAIDEYSNRTEPSWARPTESEGEH